MKLPHRWPLHPAPKINEALSSWLHRIAACYGIRAQDLLTYELGYGLIEELDTAPSLQVLHLLAQRTGIDLDRLRCMSLAGFVPWLLDSLDPLVPSALETYAFQLSVLLPKRRRKTRTLARWRAWLPRQPIQRACPLCLSDPQDHAFLLPWKLPLMLSCPVHGCWLESYLGAQGEFWAWEDQWISPRMADKMIAAMDRRTWQALTEGFVALPRRTIHAGLWFRLLRTLLEELNTPLSLCGTGKGAIRAIWEHCGLPLRAQQSTWRPYENLDPTAQVQMLHAAATAMDLLEEKVLRPLGEEAGLFLPEPQTGFTISRPAPGRSQNKEVVSPWQKLLKACDEAIAEARYNPETARSLFLMAAHGRRDPETLNRLQAMFVSMGIPAPDLSHYLAG